MVIQNQAAQARVFQSAGQSCVQSEDTSRSVWRRGRDTGESGFSRKSRECGCDAVLVCENRCCDLARKKRDFRRVEVDCSAREYIPMSIKGAYHEMGSLLSGNSEDPTSAASHQSLVRCVGSHCRYYVHG